MNAPLQIFKPLPSAIEAALRASIKRFGVMVEVIADQDGRIIDGHHRKRIADEEGVVCPVKSITVESDAHARELATTLNADRRQLDEDERREIVAALRAEGHSVRAIAGALGVGKSTVDRDLGELSHAGQLKEPPRVTGTDGKARPASNRPAKAKKEPKPPKEKKPKIIAADPKFEKLYEAVKAELVEANEKREAAADEARDLQDKLAMYEAKEPDEQQKLIAELQKKLQRKDAEIQRQRGQISDLNNKCNALIRQVKSLQKKAK